MMRKMEELGHAMERHTFGEAPGLRGTRRPSPRRHAHGRRPEIFRRKPLWSILGHPQLFIIGSFDISIDERLQPNPHHPTLTYQSADAIVNRYRKIQEPSPSRRKS